MAVSSLLWGSLSPSLESLPRSPVGGPLEAVVVGAPPVAEAFEEAWVVVELLALLAPPHAVAPRLSSAIASKASDGLILMALSTVNPIQTGDRSSVLTTSSGRAACARATDQRLNLPGLTFTLHGDTAGMHRA